MSVSGEAKAGLPDGDDQRSPQDRAEAHGRLDHQQRQVRIPSCHNFADGYLISML